MNAATVADIARSQKGERALVLRKAPAPDDGAIALGRVREVCRRARLSKKRSESDDSGIAVAKICGFVIYYVDVSGQNSSAPIPGIEARDMAQGKAGDRAGRSSAQRRGAFGWRGRGNVAYGAGAPSGSLGSERII
jgi:hypothetical protein